MDMVWGIVLLVGVLMALNNVAGGKATDVLRPVMDLVIGLMSMLVNLFIQVLRIGISAGGSSLKTARRLKNDRINDHTTTPPRW
ncbi:MAG TPA: hypothetical protein V6C97_01160 [Oculatellaceae cyanobacterium]